MRRVVYDCGCELFGWRLRRSQWSERNSSGHANVVLSSNHVHDGYVRWDFVCAIARNCRSSRRMAVSKGKTRRPYAECCRAFVVVAKSPLHSVGRINNDATRITIRRNDDERTPVRCGPPVRVDRCRTFTQQGADDRVARQGRSRRSGAVDHGHGFIESREIWFLGLRRNC
jgi:hypothetical protein